MGINKSTTKKLEYHRVFWPGNIKSTGTVNRYFRVHLFPYFLHLVPATVVVVAWAQNDCDLFSEPWKQTPPTPLVAHVV